MEGGRLNEYLGNYDYYLEKKAQLSQAAAGTAAGQPIEGSGKGTAEASNSAAGYTTSATESAVKQDWKSQKEAQSAQRKRENALKRCEERIAVLEARSAQIDEEMSLPEVCTDVARLQALSEEKAAVEEELLMKMEEWEALSE